MTAGTSTSRTIVASTSTAVARPSPISFRKTSGESASAPKTTTMIAAAAEITPAVRVRPSVTAPGVSRPRSHASRTRESRKTS